MIDNTYNTTEIFEDYNGDLDWDTFKEVVYMFNQRAMDCILEGQILDMGSYLATLSIVKIKRSYKNPTVNWGKTNKNKQKLLDQGYKEEDLYSKDNPDGIKYFIYHTDDWYVRFYWNKGKVKIPNKTAYSFKPTRGKIGNKTKLKELLARNPFAHLNYKFKE